MKICNIYLKTEINNQFNIFFYLMSYSLSEIDLDLEIKITLVGNFFIKKHQ